jgi:hypothetical protein
VLGGVVSKRRAKGGRTLQINDSKVVYAPADGLAGLERSVLALGACCAGGRWHETADGLLGQLTPDTLDDLHRSEWYRAGASERFPLAIESASGRVMANALKVEMRRAGCAVEMVSARAIPEDRLNQMFGQTRNKASVLFSLAAGHLDALLNRFARDELVVVCDRQGGREHYGRLLRLMFEAWHLEVMAESETWSDYRLSRADGRGARVVFAVGAEARALPTAAASMVAKYLRELLMGRFNAFWQGQAPGVAGTAGYYTDGLRFLRDIASAREALGIAEARLVRSR